MVPVTEKGYVSVIRNLASNLQVVCRGAEATTGKLVELEAKLSELHLKVQLLAKKAERVDDLREG